MRKFLENQKGISKITLIIIVLIVIVGIYLLVNSFSKPEAPKEENTVVEYVPVQYERKSSDNTTN